MSSLKNHDFIYLYFFIIYYYLLSILRNILLFLWLGFVCGNFTGTSRYSFTNNKQRDLPVTECIRCLVLSRYYSQNM